MAVYYKDAQGRIVARYVNCDSENLKNNPDYTRFETEENLPLDVQPELPPLEKSPLELRIEALEREVGITAAEPEKESWIDKIRTFLHL